MSTSSNSRTTRRSPGRSSTGSRSPRSYSPKSRHSPTRISPKSSVMGSEASEKFEEIMPRHTVEKALEERGFDPIEHVVVENPEGMVTAYIQALTPSGHLVYVDLDSKGDTAPKNPLVYQNTSRGISVPASTRNGLNSLSETSGCAGVAIICENGLCTMTRDNSGAPREETLTLVRPVTPEAVIPEGSFKAYPIVPFSQVMTDSKTVNSNAAKASNVLAQEAQGRCTQELGVLVEQYKSLDQSLKNMTSVYRASADNLMKSLREWRDARQKFGSKNLNEMPVEVQNTVRVLNNEIAARDQLGQHLLGICSTTSYFAQEMKTIQDQVESLTIALAQDYDPERLRREIVL